MKKNRINFLWLAVTIGIIAIATVTFLKSDYYERTKSEKRRKQYEKYLVSCYQQLPDYSKQAREKIAKPDRPDLAAIADYFATMDPVTKNIPKKRLIKAMEYYKKERSNAKSLDISLQWQGQGTTMGGRTRAITYDPNDTTHNKVWAAGVTGGLWYNNDITNASSAWTPVADFWSSLAISTIAFDPVNTQTMYVGTGEAPTAVNVYRESSGRGVGIFKSTNNGTDWALLPSTEDFAYVNDIVVKNESGNAVIYAAVVSGTYKGLNHQSIPSDGLYRSADGGSTWQQVLPDITGDTVPYAPSDIVLGADGRIYVGTQRNLDGNGAATILYSDSGLPGSWTVYNNYLTQILAHPQYSIPGRVMLATAPSDANIVYALISSGFVNTDGFMKFYCNYIARSDNKGVAWSTKTLPSDVSSGTNFATIAWHALSAAVCPTNPNELYVGGLDVFKTTDGGNTWLSRLSDWYLMYQGGGDRYVHADIHTFVYKPGSADELLIGTDGGVFFTADATNISPVFEQRNLDFSTLQFYTCDIYPQAGAPVYVGGLQDNGTLLYYNNPLSINDMIDGGDGGYCFWDKDEPEVMMTSVYYNQYSFILNQNYVTSTSGQSGTFTSPADYDYKLNILYSNAVDFQGNNANQLLRVTGVPSNTSQSFITLNTNTLVPFSSVVYSEFSPTGTSTLFVGTQSGQLFKITNAHATPVTTEITGAAFPAANLSSIALGGSEDTIVVTFSNYGVSSVWKTNNGGTTWNNAEGNLPDMPIRWALCNPNNSNYVMLATELGIWTTDNINAATVNWTPNNDGLANVRIDMLRLRTADNKVLAATHGRGFFTTTYNLSSVALNADFAANVTSIHAGDSVSFADLSTGEPTSWQWIFEGGIPATSTQQHPQNIRYSNLGLYDVTLIATNTNGSDTIVKTDYINVNNINIAEKNKPNFKITNNPSHDGVFTLQWNGLLTKRIPYVVLDANGKFVRKDFFNNHETLITIDLQGTAKGTYYLLFENNGKKETLKLIHY